MRFLPRIILLVFVMLAKNNSIGKSIEQQYIFRHLTEQNGLSYNIVNCFLKDRQGFLWIGTYDGLNRFDGFHFTVHKNNRHNQNTLANNTVHCLAEDSAGNIWAGTENGVSCYHPSTGLFENYSIKNRSGFNYIGNILCDHNGIIWATYGNGLLQYQPKENSFLHYEYDSSNLYSISSPGTYKKGMQADPNRAGLWLATAKGINFFEFATKHFINYRNNKTNPFVFNDHRTSAVAMGKNNQILFSDNSTHEIIKLDTKTKKATAIPLIAANKNSLDISAILEDSKGNYWLSSWTYQLLVINGSNPTQQTYFSHDDSRRSSVAGDFFWDAMEDKEGTIWLGTVGGISYCNSNTSIFKLHELHTKIPTLKNSQGIFAIEEDKDESWWIGTLKDGLLHYWPGSDSIKQYNTPTAKNKGAVYSQVTVFNILSVNSQLYVGTREGAFLFNKQTKQFNPLPNLPKSDLLNTKPCTFITKQNDSIIWMRSYQNGIYQYNINSQNWKQLGNGTDSVMPNQMGNIRSMFVDNQKRLWLVTGPNSLAMLNEATGHFEKININDKDSSIANGYITNVSADNRNYLWLSYKGGGLVKVDIEKQTVQRWSESDGLVFDHIMGAQADNNNRIWTAGYNKISMYDATKNIFQNFTFSISEANYDYVNRMKKLANGKILASINSTLVLIDPSRIHSVNNTRQTLINSLMIADKRKIFDERNKQVNLQYYENFFSISYGLITHTDPNRYEFTYMLQGYDKDWVHAGSNTLAAYTSIPGGNYTFRVKSISKDGQWESEEGILHIQVIPPFYKTAWFYAAVILLLAVLIFALLRIRINSIRKAEQQKNDANKMMNEWRLKALRAQMNPHFIFNCLNSIDNYILKNDEENASRYLNKFSRLVRLILNQSDATTITLAKEVEMLKYYMELETLRFDEPFTFSIDVDEEIDTEETEIPSMLLQPYVENAILHGIKHSQNKGHISISVVADGDMLLCKVQDNGIGRKRAAEIKSSRPELHTSKGLNITEQRLHMLQEAGESNSAVNIVDIINSKGEAVGTRVEIEIPYIRD